MRELHAAVAEILCAPLIYSAVTGIGAALGLPQPLQSWLLYLHQVRPPAHSMLREKLLCRAVHSAWCTVCR